MLDQRRTVTGQQLVLDPATRNPYLKSAAALPRSNAAVHRPVAHAHLFRDNAWDVE